MLVSPPATRVYIAVSTPGANAVTLPVVLIVARLVLDMLQVPDETVLDRCTVPPVKHKVVLPDAAMVSSTGNG